MKNKLILVLLLFLLTFPLLAQMKENDKLLKVGIESDLDILGPWESGFTVNEKVFWNVLEPLVTLEEKSTKIKPYLAISWKASNNNRTWLIKLREGVKFHDGSSLTADDVVASVSLFQEFEGKADKVDRLTVRFALPEPNSGFLHKLSHIKYAIASSKTVSQYKLLQKEGRLEEFIPMGSGPFKFSRWEKRNQIILESFPDYWQGSLWLEKLIYKIILDNKARLSALEKGEIDIIDIVLPADLPRIKKNPNLRVASLYGMNICYIAMNTARKPLDNMKVRQALNLAVDKLRLTRMFYYGGYGVPTNRILSPAFWGFTAIPSPGTYRPAEAERMLAEAGYDKGLALKLVFIPMARPYLPNPKEVAEEIKRQLADVGVKVSITIPATYAEFDSITGKGDFDLSLSGWINITGDPDYTLNTLLSGKLYEYNDSRWHNKFFDEKLQAARELPLSDIKGRIKLFNDAQKIFQDEAPWIPLFHTKIFLIYNRKLKGIIFYPSSMISYHKVRFQD